MYQNISKIIAKNGLHEHGILAKRQLELNSNTAVYFMTFKMYFGMKKNNEIKITMKIRSKQKIQASCVLMRKSKTQNFLISDKSFS